MKSKSSLIGITIFTVALGALLLWLTPGQTAADGHLTVIASGLDNPRGLDVGANGAVYVAEAGRGGDGPCIQGAEGEVCYGPTGAITRIYDGHQERILEGLPSLALDGGLNALGPHDIAVSSPYRAHVAIGLGGDPAVLNDPDGLGSLRASFGQVVQARFDLGDWRNAANIAAYEATANPDGAAPDTNPFGITAVGNGHAVTDAGGNTLLAVNRGNVSTIAVFPNRLVDAPPFLGLPPGTQIPMQAVPTRVVTGPDGAFYVSQLTGFPFPFGGAYVFRVVPGEDPTVYADGFTNIIDLAFDSDGNLYVLEIATNSLLSGDPTGALWRVNTDGSRDLVASEGLITPGGLAIGYDGSIYVSNCGTCPGAGEVLHVAP